MGQSSSSLVLSVIKTEVLLDCDDPANQKFLLQQYGERIEKLSQQDKLSKICMDAGFLNVVEIGQYFMTKDTADLLQFHAVACREYTLPREEASRPKGWIQGNTKIGPVLEVATRLLHGKHGVEIIIWPVNRDNTHSWVRISHESSKCVMNLNNNGQEIPEVQLEEYALKLDATDFASRSKAKAKPQTRTCRFFHKEQFILGKELGPMLDQGNIHSPIMKYRRNWFFFVMENKYIEKMTEQFISGESKKILHTPHWSDGRWKACLAAGGGDKKEIPVLY